MAHSNETKKKISQANKGKLAGENNPMFGKKRDESVKKTLSEVRKGTIWMFHDEFKECKQIPTDQIALFQIDGWERGRKSFK